MSSNSLKNRAIVSKLRIRLKETAPLIQVMVGPRQVGKTTALKSTLGNTGVYKTADYPTPLSSDALLAWWDEAEAHPSRTLAVDEIQKVTGWSETIKYLWDRSDGMKLVLTGSSSLLVEKGLKETLAGRYELIRAEHWNFAEAARILGTTLRDYLEFGCYPGSVPFLKDKNRWGDYIRDSIVEPAIGRDLLQLHPVGNPALMRQIFGAAVSLPAQLISLQKLQGATQERGTVPTIGHYLSLLGEAFLVTGLQKYSKSQFRARKSIPKLIVHDNGLCRAFERPVAGMLTPARFGRYLENAVGARLIEAGWETYYWKHRNDEVDFVTIGPENQKWAIEVKQSKASAGELKGLLRFCEQNPEFEPCLLSLVKQKIDGVRFLAPKEILSLSRT